jgi:hypothetical protein
MLFFRVFGRLIGRFFGGIGKFLVGIFKWIARHELALGVVVITGLLVGGIWLLLTVLNVNIILGNPTPVVVQAPPTTPTPQPTATPTPAPQVIKSNAPTSAETFVQAQIYFNAEQFWNALDAQLHNSLEQVGQDKAFFERRFSSLKDSGVKYTGYQYIGGYDSGKGDSIHFYVLRYIDTENVQKDSPLVLTLDKQGKIISFG